MQFKFQAEQKIVKIGGVSLGGDIGEYPTVMVGSIFFQGHGIVRDPMKGDFDKDKARALLEQEAELGEFTGNPRIIDVIGDTAQALIKYIEFVAAHSDSPILVDSPSQDTRLETIRHFAGSELMERLVYNSIAEDYTEEELACISQCGVKHAVVLALSARALRPANRLELLEKELLPAAARAGVESLIIDVGVLDIPSVGWAAQAISEVKDKWGFAAGCAGSNSLYQWRMKEKGKIPYRTACASVLSLPQCFGADFQLYGPISSAPWVYPACAATDALLAYRARLGGVQIRQEPHPLFSIF
ncbi:MAG: hypothetical protein PVG60_05565 [Desulfarculaceae bacterium]|jgi:tetrahydromethanopterin S-methyltransferase subunit H